MDHLNHVDNHWFRLALNKNVERFHAQLETAANCTDVSLQAIVSAVKMFANKCTALNRKWNIA